MESGFKVLWTEHALLELADTYKYLEKNFTNKELTNLSKEIEKVSKLISSSPELFPYSTT